MTSRTPDPRWHQLFSDATALRSHVDAWPISEAVPPRVVDYLRLTRSLVVESYYEYDFALVASMWTMLTLESTLRGALGATNATTLERLIDDARERDLIDQVGGTILHDVRKLRNLVSHNAVTFDVPPEAVLQWIGSLQAAISDIYTRASADHAT